MSTVVETVNARDRSIERFTLGDVPEADARIGRDLAALTLSVRDHLGPRLKALLLVGSYARGEGGVVARNGALGPYNDYDLVAVVSNGARRLRAGLFVLAADWTRRLGVDVDIWPIDSLALRAVPATLFWLDASLGGLRVLYGDPAVVKPIQTLQPRNVPLEECGRLLANRAVGIALSNMEGEEATDESMGRHGHKSVLACGDVLLLAAGRYAPTLRERMDALSSLRDAPAVGQQLIEAYREAMVFRSRPDLWFPPEYSSVRAWYEALRPRIQQWHLEFETWRVGAPGTPAAFAAWRGRLFLYLSDVRPGGSLVAAARVALTRSASMFPYVGHPRERLARVAVALAYGRDDSYARAKAAQLLGVSCIQPAPHADPTTRVRLVSFSHKAG